LKGCGCDNGDFHFNYDIQTSNFMLKGKYGEKEAEKCGTCDLEV
jgi:hypothetical protein